MYTIVEGGYFPKLEFTFCEHTKLYRWSYSTGNDRLNGFFLEDERLIKRFVGLDVFFGYMIYTVDERDFTTFDITPHFANKMYVAFGNDISGDNPVNQCLSNVSYADKDCDKDFIDTLVNEGLISRK
jgi:hypothetical protein